MRTFHIGGAAQLNETSPTSKSISHDGHDRTIATCRPSSTSAAGASAMSRTGETRHHRQGRPRAGAMHRIALWYGARCSTMATPGEGEGDKPGPVGSVHPAGDHGASRASVKLPGPGRQQDAGPSRRGRGDGHRPARRYRISLRPAAAPRRTCDPRLTLLNEAADSETEAAKYHARVPAPCSRSRTASRSRRATFSPVRQPRSRQDARHHRRSAAGGRAVRGTHPQGQRRSSPRFPVKDRVRARLQGQAQDRDRAGRGRSGGISHPQDQGARCSGRRFRQARATI